MIAVIKANYQNGVLIGIKETLVTFQLLFIATSDISIEQPIKNPIELLQLGFNTDAILSGI